MNLWDTQHNFSQEYPLSFLSSFELEFLDQLNSLKTEYRFPSIKNDIGYFFNFLITQFNLQNIYEFGSGYGHSCFWYLVGEGNSIVQNIYLNEIKPQYKDVFKSLNWKDLTKANIDYHQGDAFDNLDMSDIDFLLVDGHKSDYLKFIEAFEPLLSDKAFVAIDNAFWKGSVVIDNIQSKKSTQAIRELHQKIKDSFGAKFRVDYFPYEDGLVLLKKIN